MKVTPLYDAIQACDTEIIVLQGGTWSAKTYSALQALTEKAVNRKNEVTTIAGQDMPNLKVGPIRQLEEILADAPAFKAQVAKHNKTENSYLFRSGSIIEFKSYENAQDAKSGKRHRLFINEGNGFQYEVVKQLMLRTSIQTIVDFNPDVEFWAHEKLKDIPNAKWFYSDHRHNPFVPAKIRKEIEDLKLSDYELWKVYARGMTGKVEGLIYRNWEVVNEEFPRERFIDSCFGLDFGFNHPTALVEVGWTETEYFVRELIYESGLITAELINRMKGIDFGKKQIFCDSARPDTIEELAQAGFNVMQADKSVKDGINAVKAKRLKIYQSPGLYKEIKAYRWKTDRNGKPVDEPVKVNDDACDALRYAIFNGTKQIQLTYDW